MMLDIDNHYYPPTFYCTSPPLVNRLGAGWGRDEFNKNGGEYSIGVMFQCHRV